MDYFIVEFFYMVQTVSITVQPGDEKNPSIIHKQILLALEKAGEKDAADGASFVLEKRSVDARHGKIKLILRYKICRGGENSGKFEPKWKNAGTGKTVAIIGSGPAGLFGALTLLEKGIKPVIIERGEECPVRKRIIAKISVEGTVDSNSNYCFGEGGAGTFSDGKLYTRSNKRGNISEILSIFNYFGADEKILTDSHPHIGTDKLPKIIQNMKEKIISLGGEFFFGFRCTGFMTEEKGGKKRVTGVIAENTKTGEKKDFRSDAVLLATGHSAFDVYDMISRISPESLEAKTFAIGVRVEHPRETIDMIRYHSMQAAENLGAAEYRLTSQQDGRGVYSFCMCPGGFVVPSASGPEEIVVNGMSAAGRNSAWSNAAIVVETRPEDIPERFISEAEEKGCRALAGLLWRSHIEKETFKNGRGQKAPAQRLVDFLDGKESMSLPKSSYAPGLIPSRIDAWLPAQISSRLKKAFRAFNGEMKGFICPDALVIASETRTSTPVRILRDKDTGECVSLENLYPAGEGSGYSGGIVSSAMDGINECRHISEKVLKMEEA